jgi:hypothetical protein
MFVQIMVASEFMIFPVRALGFMWTNRPSTALIVAVILTAIAFSILAFLGVPHNLGPLGDIFGQALGWSNMLICWAWGVGGTLLLDLVKYTWVQVVDGTTEEIVWERVQERWDANLEEDKAARNAASGLGT